MLGATQVAPGDNESCCRGQNIPRSAAVERLCKQHSETEVDAEKMPQRYSAGQLGNAGMSRDI